jgi:type II secretory pathway component PulF
VPGNVFKGLLLRLIAAGRIGGMMESSLDRLAAVLAQKEKL